MAKLKNGTTIGNYEVWHAGNGGDGSQLDAGLLGGLPSSSYVKMSGSELTGFLVLHSDPIEPMHPTSKQYVDATRLGLSTHDPCRVASTANINLTTGGLLTIDGVTLVAGDRVLVKNQTDSTQNGIYVAAAGAWSRASDANTPGLLPPGTYTYIESGTTQHDTSYALNLQGGNPEIGVTPLDFNLFARIETTSAGAGLSKVNTTFSVSDGGITDTMIGTRTINQAAVPSSHTAVLTTLLSGVANRIKAITGAANWYSDPATTIAALSSGKLDATEVSATPAANKVLRLNASSLLPASITGNAATATNVEWTGVLNKPASYTPVAHKSRHHVYNGEGQPAGDDIITPEGIGALSTSLVKATPSVGEVPKVDTSGKVNISITGEATSVTSVPWARVTSQPASYTPSVHKTTHYSKSGSVGADPIYPDDIDAVHKNMLVTSTAGNQGKILVLNANAKLDVSITGKADTAGVADSALAAPWSGLTGVPTTFNTATHATKHAQGGSDPITAASIGAVDDDLLVTVAAANKLLLLNADSKLPASITGTATPLNHAASHAAGQGDQITPAAIGAAATAHDHTTGSQVPAAGILDGAVTDAKIASRTITDGTTPTADSAVLTTLLSNLANRIKAATGQGSWRDAPATTLLALNTGKASLSGATFTGQVVLAFTEDNKLILRSTDADNKAYLSFQNSAATELIKFGYDGTNLVFGTNKVWHEGNDGTGSGLDADLLAGVAATSYMRTSEATPSATANKLLYLDANAKLPASITGDAATVGGLSASSFAVAGDTEARLQHRPTFSVGNDDWTGLVYGDSAACTYSAADSGVTITGAAKNAKLKVRMPVDADGVYFARVKITKKTGTSNFSIGAVPLGANYAELNADSAGVYNQFVCSNQALAAGNSMFVSGFISGYNAAGGTDVSKFDPGTRYLDLIVQANLAGAAGDVLVVNSIELWRMPYVNAAAYIASAPTTSDGALPAIIGGLMNRIKAISGEANWYTTPATALTGKLNLSGGTLTGALTLSGAPTVDLHAATKAYVDSSTSTHAAASAAHTAANVSFSPAGTIAATTVQAAIAELDGDVGTKVAKAGDTLTGFLTLHADPTNAMHAVTKQYVDNVAQGLDPKASCRVATTANITLSGIQTIDGVAVVAGNRVLVKNQSTASQNGIYVVAAGAWTRATDFDVSADVTSGAYVFIEEGTSQANSGWALTTDNPITLGTTSLSFVQFSGAGMITAGTGISKTGDTISLSSGVCTPGTYRSLTVDTYGRVTAGTAPTTLSGYGITDAMPYSGGSFTGFVTLHAAPTADMHAATKKYVDDTAAMFAAMMS